MALPGDPSEALWWNPAALAFAEWQSAELTHARVLPGLADDVVYNHVAVASPFGKRLGLGVSGTFLSYGESVSSDPSGIPITFEPTEWSWAAAAGYRILPELSTGLAVKYIRLKLAPESQSGEASTVGFDFSSLYRKALGSAVLSAGFNVQNIGPEVKFPPRTRGGRCRATSKSAWPPRCPCHSAATSR